MAFVKLDTGILNSTLWVERECREVFITALLMADPREFIAPLPQIEVRSLTLTGWSAPPGWYGFVEAAGVGIVRRAMVDQEVGMAALEKLGAVDIESRSKDFDGRRLIRVDGGYLVLNFMKYRDRDYTGAVRAQRYRDRKKALADAASRRDISASHRDITQAEEEVESENTRVPPALVGSVAPNGYRVPDCPYDELLALYHELCPTMSRVRVMTNMRMKHTRCRWVEVATGDKMDKAAALEWFRWYFKRAGESAFLSGRSRAGRDSRVWTADFEWLMTGANFAKVIEGRYHQELTT